MTEAEERAWMEGQRAAYARIMGECLPHLDGDTRDAAKWALERAAAVAALRELCRDFGDNDWPDGLHLADVIEKYLGRHLHAEDDT